jgi:V/A-type H+-transporting ATPase subunit C
MPAIQSEKTILSFYTYPPIGGNDWRYAFETAQIRTLEMQMLTRATLQDMANTANYEQAVSLLGSGEYAMPQAGRDFSEVEDTLQARRITVRQLFADLMIDKDIVELFRTRDDFANLRLAVRRMLTEKPLGTDYSADGNVPPERLEELIAEHEEFEPPIFPDYILKTVEQAVLAYYQNKDIRQIDYAIDNAEAKYRMKSARRLESIFLLGLFRIQIDLNNIRTMLRLKFAESELRNVFIDGGFIELERFEHGLDLGLEALGTLFFATPYYKIVEAGAGYLATNKSFLKIEQQCDEFLTGFLKTTVEIVAGPQPIIAYLLLKENEIRTIRLILTAKRNNLDTRLLLDRIGT